MKTLNENRPGAAPELQLHQICGQHHRSLTFLPRPCKATVLIPLSPPPAHQPRDPHRRRRQRRLEEAAAFRRRRGRQRNRGEAAAQQNDDEGHPISAPPPEIRRIHTLFTPPERRSGDPPSSRRRSGRRRVRNPPDTPAGTGRAEVALESPLERRGEEGDEFQKYRGRMDKCTRLFSGLEHSY